MKDKNMQDESAGGSAGVARSLRLFPLAVVSVIDGTAIPSLAQARDNRIDL